jgi:hypothetical protein
MLDVKSFCHSTVFLNFQAMQFILIQFLRGFHSESRKKSVIVKVIDLFNTFPESIYSLILVEYSGNYDYWKFTVSCG